MKRPPRSRLLLILVVACLVVVTVVLLTTHLRVSTRFFFFSPAASFPPPVRIPRGSCVRIIVGIFTTSTSESTDEAEFKKWLPLVDTTAATKTKKATTTMLECGLNFVMVYGEPATTELPGRVVLTGMHENMNEGKSFRWFHDASRIHFPEADYIFKMDSDVGICPPMLLDTIQQAASSGANYIGWPHTFWSCGEKDYCPAKDGTGWRYVSGGFYGLSRDAALRVSYLVFGPPPSSSSSSLFSSFSSSSSTTPQGDESLIIGIEDLLMGKAVYRAMEEAGAGGSVKVFPLECMAQRDAKGHPIIEPLEDCPVKHFASFHPLKLMPRKGPMCSSSSSSYTIEVFMTGRLGNQMFQYAAATAIAQQVGMKGVACIRSEENHSERVLREEYFVGPFVFPCGGGEQQHEQQPQSKQKSRRRPIDVTERGYALADPRLLQAPLRFSSMHLHIRTFFQSWRYFEPVKQQVRQMFQVKDANVRRAAEDTLAGIVAKENSNNNNNNAMRRVTTVGIHVRRGDHVNSKRPYLRFPGADYFRRAMEHFELQEQQQEQVVFIVASDDPHWCLEQPFFKNKRNVHVLKKAASSASSVPAWLHDFAVLSMCEHFIVTLGTFGWWAAYLVPGTVVYGRDVFVMDHEVNRGLVSLDDYFPPWWIAL